MTIESSRHDVGVAPTAPPFWNNPSIRALFYQLVLVGGVIAVGAYLVQQTRSRIWRARASPPASASSTARRPSRSAKPSSNTRPPTPTAGRCWSACSIRSACPVSASCWRPSSAPSWASPACRATAHPQARRLLCRDVRNVPLCCSSSSGGTSCGSARRVRRAWQVLPDVFVSNRGVVFPLPVDDPLYPWIGVALVVAIAATVFLRRWAHARQMATGEQFPVLKTSVALIIACRLSSSSSAHALRPRQAGAARFNFSGGHVVSPEFVALLVGLVVYTGAFIARSCAPASSR